MQKITSNTPSIVAATLAVLALIALTAADYLLGVRFNASVVYPTLLLSCFLVKNRRFVWFLTAGALISNILMCLEGDARAILHRGVAAAALIATAITVHELIRAWKRLQEDQRVLEKNHAELGAREAEIARQNEELLSQTEELERQSEELRVINDELAGRERMLEALLDLSRSLTAELTEDQVMSRVCEALGGLINGRASGAAIVLEQDERAVVRCHEGFGPGGLVSDHMPFDKSFASLIMNQGQSGYLEDVTLRSDLQFPQPKEGERFQAVLAAPLRVHGRAVGTLEAYSHERRKWSEEQIALVESLAAQTSISLETARLFQEIERQRRRFEAVFRTLPIGVLVADDPQCLMVRGNPAAAAMYNAPADANFSPFAPPDVRIRRSVYRAGEPITLDSHPLFRAVRTGQELRGEEIEVVFPDGRSLSLLVSAAPIFGGAESQIDGGVCAFVDITALKRIEQELDRRRREAEEASVRKTRFLAAVSHDIRTPANAISLLAELIQRSAPNPALASGIPDLAKDLRASALSLVELVSDVLDVARFDSGGIDLQETEFWLGDAIAEECRQLLPLARDKSLELKAEPINPPIRLRADRIKLGRVIANLLGNAIKFTEPGGAATIRARIEPNLRVRIDVVDDGIGIAPEHLPHIFDEFFQLRNPERDRNKGMGLGLTICKRLVDAMGGKLEARSQLGQGSEFSISLPASAVVPAAPELDAASAREHALSGIAAVAADGGALAAAGGMSDGSLAGVRVLLVEDHHCTRRATVQMLQAHNAIVAEAPDARTALAQLLQFRPQVMLLDMMLPDQDGEEILKHLRNDRPAELECVVVLTGDATVQRLERVRALGADGIVTKPVDFGRLIAQVHRCRRQVLKPASGNGD